MNPKSSAYLLSIIAFLACSSCSKKVNSFEFESGFYRIQITDTAPFVKYFSADALGESKLDNNVILWQKLTQTAEYELYKVTDSRVRICRKGSSSVTGWSFKFMEKNFTLTSFYNNDSSSGEIEFRFDKNKNHATLLGLMESKGKTKLPALLHLPDMGTFLLETDQPAALVDYDAARYRGKGHISVKLHGADKKNGSVRYTFSTVSIFPEFPGVEQVKYSGFRRNYLNLYQVNPVFQVLANNSCSDPVAFTLFMSSMLALSTPPLTDSFSALDLVRMSVERYLNGMKGYGMVGYMQDVEGTEIAAWNSPYYSLDTYPSLVIAACNYIKGSGDIQWAQKYYQRIKDWMDAQMKRDYDQNGLVEYELSGNSGSWDGVVRPANWWDTIGFGHEDAFSNAITFDALNLLSAIADMLGMNEDSEKYRRMAERMKSGYFKTFYNPATGVLAGWKSKDGKLHDYCFLMVNSMAVCYNLVPEDRQKDIMNTLWKKMKEAGYTDFSLGVPGNLVPVRKEDYTHPDPRWGGGQMEDGSDAFQRYENGGASLNWSYFTLKAFQKAGLEEQFNIISDGIIEGINKGEFQGSCSEGGMTRDWKTWSGECWGYEGFLCDGFLVLMALIQSVR